jgi:hypothetical protein
VLRTPDAFLIVEKGEPYGVGDALPLSRGTVLLGRDCPDGQRGFFYFSPYISRRHATIEYEDGSHLLTDLESRHGTRVNDKPLTPGEPYKLGDRDRISLARDEVVLVYSTASPAGGQTWDYPESQPGPPMAEKPDCPLILDQERREVILDGKPLPLRGKPYALLELLYENRGRAVSTFDIKTVVWKERGLGADGMPLVTDGEVNNLVYRLRLRMGPHRDLVHTVSGFGYRLDLQ